MGREGASCQGEREGRSPREEREGLEGGDQVVGRRRRARTGRERGGGGANPFISIGDFAECPDLALGKAMSLASVTWRHSENVYFYFSFFLLLLLFITCSNFILMHFEIPCQIHSTICI